MRVSFEASFARDLKQIRDKRLLQRVQAAIEEIKLASDVLAVSGLSKMQGYDAFYRIRLGDYRIGVEIVGEMMIFVRCLHRKDIYRYFP